MHWIVDVVNTPRRAVACRAYLSRPRLPKLKDFIARVLRDFDESDRSYMTIAIGCTGGQHRSVYLTEKLHRDLITQFPAAQIRHRDLQEAGG